MASHDQPPASHSNNPDLHRRTFVAMAASLPAVGLAAAASGQITSGQITSGQITSGQIAPSPPPFAPPTPNNQGKAWNLGYAPHAGMFEDSAGKALPDQIAFLADEGFRGFEDNGLRWRDRGEQEAIARALSRRNVRMGIFVAHNIDWDKPTLTTGEQAPRDRFLADIRESTEIAKRVNATWATTVVGRVAQNLPMGHQFANVVETLRRASEICEKTGLVMVVEPLNWRDHPGQFAPTSAELHALAKAVDSPSCKILFDLYHLQVTEGNLIDNMNRCWDQIAYFQIGDNPGRQEPGTGEVNYRNVFKHIHTKGYKGLLGMEHGVSNPGKPGERALIDAYRAADDF